MKRSSGIDRALDSAKAFFDISPGEPLAPRDKVLIRELIHAQEILLTPDGTDLSSDYLPEVYERTLASLISGRLIAVTLQDDAIIPAQEWNVYRHVGEDAFHSGFWTGELSFLHHDPPFRDKTPVVDRSAATDWISWQSSCPRKGGRPRIAGVAEAYWRIYPDGHKAIGVQWEVARRRVSEEIGEDISESLLKRRVRQER